MDSGKTTRYIQSDIGNQRFAYHSPWCRVKLNVSNNMSANTVANDSSVMNVVRKTSTSNSLKPAKFAITRIVFKTQLFHSSWGDVQNIL